MKKILLDTDVGTDVDDALALALAIRSPEIDLRAVTTVSCDPLLRARIARKILILGGRTDIPVAAGLGTSLLRKSQDLMLGHEGKGVLESEQDGLPVDPKHGVDMIIKMIMQAEEPLTLVTIGPVSNVALAIIREPSIIQRIEQMVIMGGCIYPELVGDGRFPEDVAAKMEHNLGADPEATEVVLGSGIPTILVPAEITYQVWLTEEDMARLRDVDTPLVNTLAVAIDIWAETYKKMLVTFGLPQDWARLYLHDPLTLTVAFDKRFVKTEPMHLYPERKQGLLRIFVDKNKEPNAEVCVAVEVDAFRQFLLERILTQ
jgi:purine nucleosidase